MIRESTLPLSLMLATSSEADNIFRQSITTSLSESIYSFRHEYGRTYHGKLLSPDIVQAA